MTFKAGKKAINKGNDWGILLYYNQAQQKQ